MSPEFVTPPSESSPHTPESIQECVSLARAIDQQVEAWLLQGSENHPAYRARTIAEHIVLDSTPIDDEGGLRIDIPRLHQDVFERRAQKEYAQRLHHIANFLQSAPFETILPTHPVYAAYFEQLRDYNNHADDVDEPFKDASEYMMRLFVAREQLARRLQNESFNVVPFNRIFALLVGDKEVL